MHGLANTNIYHLLFLVLPEQGLAQIDQFKKLKNSNRSAKTYNGMLKLKGNI